MIRQEYTIIDSNDKNTIIADVNGFLLQGWLPQGGMCLQTTLIGSKIVVRYAQALVRDIEVPGAWG